MDYLNNFFVLSELGFRFENLLWAELFGHSGHVAVEFGEGAAERDEVLKIRHETNNERPR